MINAEQNQGLPYAYDEVVRKKDQRKRLTGGSCEQCKEVCIFSFFFNTIVNDLYGLVVPEPRSITAESSRPTLAFTFS